MSLLLLFGGISVASDRVVTTLAGTTGVAVTPQWSFASICDLRSADANHAVKLQIRWYDLTGAFISDSTGVTGTATTGAWVTLTEVATSPINACFAAVKVSSNMSGGQATYLDNIGLFRITTPYTG